MELIRLESITDLQWEHGETQDITVSGIIRKSANRADFTASKTVYVKTVVLAEKIDYFRNYLPSLNSWSETKNCASFATVAWNRAGGTTITLGAVETSTSLASKIKKISGYKNGVSDDDFVNASTAVKHY